MITASVVTYEHHLLDIEPVLRSLFASPFDVVYVIDHSEKMLDLEKELSEYTQQVLHVEPSLKQKVDGGLEVHYLRHANNGYGGGHNVAIRKALEAGSRYHLVVNPDVWFGPEVIAAMVQYMESHPDVGQMMPKVLFPNGEIQRLAKLLPTPLDFFGRLCLPGCLINRRNRRFELVKSGFNMTLNVPYLSGCFMLFRTSALEEIGLFDEHFFMYAEDIDVTRRMHARYQTLFYPEQTIYHKFSRGSRHSLWLFWVHFKNIVMYLNRWGWFHDPERTRWNRDVIRQIAQKSS